MPVLSNPRHEAFAQAVAKGMSATEAYEKAGYKPNQPNASRLISNDMVASRIEELLSRGADRAEVDVALVLKELARLGMSDLRNAFTDDGRLKDPKDWTDDFAASVSSIKVVTRSLGEGEVEYVHEVKTWDKNSALEKLGKYLGMFVERAETVNHNYEISDKPMSPEEWAAKYARPH